MCRLFVLTFAVALAACDCAYVSPGAGSRIVRGPFLQHPGGGSGSMTVAWETDEPSAGVVFWAKEGEDKLEKRVSADVKRHHEVVLKGLEEGERYRYRVQTDYGWSKDYVFSPFPAGESAYRFLVYGDSRTNDAAHQAVVKEMKKRGGAFFVHTGDLVTHGGHGGDWNAFFLSARPLLARIPFFPVIGNHDYPTIGTDHFRSIFALPQNSPSPELDYFFDTGNARFVVMDNRSLGKKGAQTKEWLLKALKEARTAKKLDHVFVFIHRGVQSTGPHGPDPNLEKKGFAELMRSYGVTMVIAGHDHMYERGLVKGLRYMVTAGGGAPLYKKKKGDGEGKLMRTEEHHFVAFDVDGKKAAFDVVRPDGTLVESCRLEGKGYACAK